MKQQQFFPGIIGFFMMVFSMTAFAQSGDQILDGIGETGLIARYTLAGDLEDGSRNNWQASIQGTEFAFVEDEQFGKVLSFPEGGKSYLSIPGAAVVGEESISLCAWVYLRADRVGQRFFDFGQNGQSHFFVAPSGTLSQLAYLAQIQAQSRSYSASSTEVSVYRWQHLAVVINVPAKTLSTFLNGQLVAETKGVNIQLAEVFSSNGEDNQLLVGKALGANTDFLNAKIHDLRLYRIPLNEQQVARIHNNAMKVEEATVRTRSGDEEDFITFPESTPQLYNPFLKSVSDIEVETVVGHLPRLPRYLSGVYRKKIKGPKVRVLWPAPEDNSPVESPGTYTIRGRVPGTNFQPKATVRVEAAPAAATPKQQLEPFALGQVSLAPKPQNEPTKFIENRDKFITGLAETNPDDFLYMFRNAFGQEQPAGAQALKGWDSQETKLRGHATGHYLTAIAQAYASTTYDEELQADFAQKMTYMVNTLYDLSQLSGQVPAGGGDFISDPSEVPPGPGKVDFDSDLSEEGIRTDYWLWGKGFISAYPPDQFIMLENGARYGRDDAKIWAPYYTLHKILAGLMDIYEVSGNEKALHIVEGMGDWVHARLSQVPQATLINMWNRYIAGEYGGMNEAMARLYRLTGKERYLETAQLFDNIKMFYGDAEHSHGLAKNVDMFRGLHANQHIPQIMGAIEMYRVSDRSEYYHIADNFWTKATNDYMYSIGGVAGARNPANAECFTTEPATLYTHGFSAGGQNETCATYNMLKVTKNLFLFDQRAELMDYYERSLYNHILASVAEDSPANTYHVPLRPGSVKRFGNAEMGGFTCCNGTALESSTKLQNAIYFKRADKQALYVNLFIPSVLDWSEKNIKISQTTAFPKEDRTQLRISGNGTFDLKVRVPRWATAGFEVKINGNIEKVKAEPGTYLTLSRDWKEGDIIELQMPFEFHLEPVMDQQNIASLFYGPILLAAQESEPRDDWRQIRLKAKKLGKWIDGDPEKLTFTIDGVVFKPFYETYGRHSVYLDVRLK
ncbi:MAG TPA: beta-L-arabinofuranosidase domain-containing protein [Saprospiraceae bacterium]|nr:beta-L-arabinofuranosidase domain-containing protein [Saprospiraceae bacterium]